MGKIRIKTLGIEELEKEQAQEAKKRKEAKKEKSASRRMAKGAHGGERVVSMAPTEEELEKMTMDQTTDYSLQTSTVDASQNAPDKQSDSSRSTVDQKKNAPRAQKQRSKRYRDGLIQVDRSRLYPISEAIGLLKKLGTSRFDGTVELHINTTEKGLSGQVNLPHGTGKTVRVTIADPATNGQLDKLLADIEKGVVNFDVLIATPSAMPKLAKVAKILGPRGLMPNPKSGTISDTPTKLLEKFQGGQVNFRTESQAPIIHATIGKVSFKEKDLEENVGEFLKAVGVGKIRSVTLKSTMSPGIKIDFSSLS